MSCNSCAKAFSLLRPEKGCPNCGFSYCSNCLKYKVFLDKLNSEVKVCAKCKDGTSPNKSTKVEPPDAYYKRVGTMDVAGACIETQGENSVDKEISERLKKLKEDPDKKEKPSNDMIADKLQKLKGELPTTSDAELRARLAKLKEVPISAVESKPVIIQPNTGGTEQEIESLMKQLKEESMIEMDSDEEHCLAFQESVNQQMDSGAFPRYIAVGDYSDESDGEQVTYRMIEQTTRDIQQVNIGETSNPNELPFCIICDEDPDRRCLGCRYLYCHPCFKDHEDEDGCDQFVMYTPPKDNAM